MNYVAGLHLRSSRRFTTGSPGQPTEIDGQFPLAAYQLQLLVGHCSAEVQVYGSPAAPWTFEHERAGPLDNGPVIWHGQDLQVWQPSTEISRTTTSVAHVHFSSPVFVCVLGVFVCVCAHHTS